MYKSNGIWYVSPGIIHHPFKAAIKTDKEEIWYDYGTVHRVDGPAFISKNEEIWYNYGKIHRLEGPALIRRKTNGKINYRAWYYEGVFHRNDGPAVEDWSKDLILFYQFGKKHRLDGPAVLERGNVEWYKNGKLHRIDGPAIPSEDRWYFNGIEVTKEFRKWCANNFIDRFNLTEEDKFFIQMKWE